MDASVLAESINSITNIGKKAYICVDFGIIELDAENEVVLETYKVGTSVSSIQVVGEKTYVARSDGFFHVESVSRMHDRNSWHKLGRLNLLVNVRFMGKEIGPKSWYCQED